MPSTSGYNDSGRGWVKSACKVLSAGRVGMHSIAAGDASVSNVQ